MYKAASISKPKIDHRNEISLSDYTAIIDEVKDALPQTSREQKIQALTIFADKFTLNSLQATFSISQRLCKQASELKADNGIISVRNFSKGGRPLPDATKIKVLEMYESNEYTRVMPGAKDVISAKTAAGEKLYKSQRLMLCNNAVLHQKFSEKHPDAAIGKSKFAELKPKWVKSASVNGSHNICVCTYHQNTKFMVCKLKDVTYYDLMAGYVCDVANRECMLGRCTQCPGTERLR